MKWAAESVKSYFESLDSLPGRGANKNLLKRQCILEFHKASAIPEPNEVARVGLGA